MKTNRVMDLTANDPARSKSARQILRNHEEN
jgi:hypothetical protein